METGIGSHEWGPRPLMPTALAPLLNLSADADPGVVATVGQEVARWKGVMLKTCTINVKGLESVDVDFIFVPALFFDGTARESMKQSFEGFIVALFTLVGFEEGHAPWGGAVRAPNRLPQTGGTGGVAWPKVRFQAFPGHPTLRQAPTGRRG